MAPMHGGNFSMVLWPHAGAAIVVAGNCWHDRNQEKPRGFILDPAVDRLLLFLESRMNTNTGSINTVLLAGESAMHSPAPRSPHHAALFLLAHSSAPRRRALPGTTITAPANAFNHRL
ncbi:hypothetical protein [Herbaspirillum sp. SJZ130]|uniref:hypothetical protein n=1 Tax=Herbaspirillum sp. SJZ130 TaxID=2572918 RepID=UPI00115315D2|nr:hypothetical protein [Herbaspirillum sp. SJZ130]MBB5392720.1 hypothetical protein [Herbaspirillum sp. SJZ102]